MSKKGRDEMLEILEKERTSILSASYYLLPELELKKSQLAPQLGSLTRAQARSISTRIDRNQVLLLQAIDGITSAKKRLEELAMAHTKLSVYSANGKIKRVKDTTASAIRRA